MRVLSHRSSRAVVRVTWKHVAMVTSGRHVIMRSISLGLFGLALLPAALQAQERAPVLRSDPMMGVHVGVPVGEGIVNDAIMTTYRVTALRVWRERVANYVGVEGAMTLFGLTGRLGVFGRRGLGGPAPFRLGLDLGLFM